MQTTQNSFSPEESRRAEKDAAIRDLNAVLSREYSVTLSSSQLETYEPEQIRAMAQTLSSRTQDDEANKRRVLQQLGVTAAGNSEDKPKEDSVVEKAVRFAFIASLVNTAASLFTPLASRTYIATKASNLGQTVAGRRRFFSWAGMKARAATEEAAPQPKAVRRTLKDELQPVDE